MVESLKFRPLESGSAEAGFKVIGSDTMSEQDYSQIYLQSKLPRLDFFILTNRLHA